MGEDIKHHIKTYRNVFFSLLILTVLTVAVSYIHFPYLWLGLFVGLAIASFKGYLVASEFMHLNDEKNWIYGTLIVTVLFLFVLLFMPLSWHSNGIGYGNGAYENVSHGGNTDTGHHNHEEGH